MARVKAPRLLLNLCDEQKVAKDLISQRPVNFILGKAGSGKTFLACYIALSMLGDRTKIVITRPTVGTEDNGFIPGSLDDKLEPWMVPIKDNFKELLGAEVLKKMETEHIIEIVSLQHFRGRTFKNAICIVDEFQNLKSKQLAMVIGRLGIDSTMILCGDKKQVDVKEGGVSVIKKMELLKDCRFVNIITLLENHRHPALDEILDLLDE